MTEISPPKKLKTISSENLIYVYFVNKSRDQQLQTAKCPNKPYSTQRIYLFSTELGNTKIMVRC